MKNSLATIILAGGSGTRMGSSDRHKVCFEVGGEPVILRALETYTLCGAGLHVVVVGTLAENVMATVAPRFPGTAYAFQPRPLGTGDAAAHGARLLEQIGFDGDVLVVAGDKLIEPGVIRRLIRRHRRAEADLTVVTVSRPEGHQGGLILERPRGRLAGIVETGELRRLMALADLRQALAGRTSLPPGQVRKLLLAHFEARKAAAFLGAAWSVAEAGQPLTRERFEALYPPDERSGLLETGGAKKPAREVDRACRLANLSTYLFRASALYDGIARLRPARADQETYLTDLVGLLARRRPRPARVIGYEIADRREVMAFNNPQELIEVNAHFLRRERDLPAVAASGEPPRLASARRWLALFDRPSAAARRRFRGWYGGEPPWDNYRETLTAFAERFGFDRPLALVRSPGRINLLGRHIDHQGGSVNVMAINREILVAAAPNTDGLVRLTNTDPAFPARSFRLADVIAQLDWDDWQQAVDGPRLQRLLEGARGHWAHYFQAAMLRLQERFRDRCLRGMDVLVHGAIPMGAGLSSSSALVVAAAEATALFNGLAVTSHRLVSLCGEGEWFVGTRGGAADHAAIKLSRRGYVTRVGFFPFRIEESAPFFDDHDLLVCNSGIEAGKSAGARNRFNAKVAAYHLGRLSLRLLRPDLASRIEHLRDAQPRRLGLTRAEHYRLLSRLPAAMTRSEARRMFAAPADRDYLDRLFATHDEPREGYSVRGVTVFGLGEMARARRCLSVMASGRAGELGRLMDLSHDGDRVSRRAGPRTWKRAPSQVGVSELLALGRRKGDGGALWRCPGAYGCSLPQIDRLVDTLRAVPGVRGAQMAGAGLGGCVMALVRRGQADAARAAVEPLGAHCERFTPIAGASVVRAE